MPEPIVVKAGSEDPDPLSGISYPIPRCLDQLRKVSKVIVTDDEDEQTLIQAVPGARVLMITYGLVSRRGTSGTHTLIFLSRRHNRTCSFRAK